MPDIDTDTNSIAIPEDAPVSPFEIDNDLAYSFSPDEVDPKSINTEKMRPVLIRHRYSGVWVGYIVGRGTFAHNIAFLGRRIWQWNGGRLELSQVAAQGLRTEDRLGEWEVVEIACGQADGLIELRTVKREMVEQAKALPADGEAR